MSLIPISTIEYRLQPYLLLPFQILIFLYINKLHLSVNYLLHLNHSYYKFNFHSLRNFLWIPRFHTPLPSLLPTTFYFLLLPFNLPLSILLLILSSTNPSPHTSPLPDHQPFFLPFPPPLNFKIRFIDHHHNAIYQSILILNELFQHNLINVSYLTACYLYQVMMTLMTLNQHTNRKLRHNR